MKVTAIVGSARKKYTYNSTEQLLKKLQTYGQVEYEIVKLSDYRLEACKGCKLCFENGEETCTLKDDRDILIKKMKNSDGVIFATPNYSFQVSALMKIFLDRIAFIFHRPVFFGKTFTNIVAQGMYGGKNIVKYLDFVGDGLGFNVVKGSFFNTLEPMTEKGQKKIDNIIEKQSKKFYSELIKKRYPVPTLLKLMIFRMSRTSIKLMLNESYRDYKHFLDNGLFKSDYFYPVKLNLFKKFFGKIFDIMAAKMSKN